MRVIDARAAFQPVDAGIAVEVEQVGVGEFEVEAVLVRDAVVLRDADIGRGDELRLPARSTGCRNAPAWRMNGQRMKTAP